MIKKLAIRTKRHEEQTTATVPCQALGALAIKNTMGDGLYLRHMTATAFAKTSCLLHYLKK
jgi:hypothetical protein